MHILAINFFRFFQENFFLASSEINFLEKIEIKFIVKYAFIKNFRKIISGKIFLPRNHRRASTLARENFFRKLKKFSPPRPLGDKVAHLLPPAGHLFEIF